MPGLPTLRNAIADKIRIASDSVYDAESEITVTAGATQALLTAILTFVHAGDEVIIIEPAYDSYLPSIHLAGGIAKPVQMELDGNRYFIPWDKVKQSITPRTRMLILNSPHNPTGTVLTQDDIQALKDCVKDSGILILSDEVYEHIIFDGQIHASMASDPELKACSLIVSSFGKTFHVTGWKVGYIAAPKMLSTEFRKVHQYNVFTVNSPMQAALAEHLLHSSQHWELPAFYQEKRDYFRHGLQQTRFELLPCLGTYFQSVRYRDISDLPEREFAEWITKEAGVACIPMSAFYQKSTDSGVVRFCFAKRQRTLDQALQRLQAL
jgi:methionine aminotransferase